MRAIARIECMTRRWRRPPRSPQWRKYLPQTTLRRTTSFPVFLLDGHPSHPLFPSWRYYSTRLVVSLLSRYPRLNLCCLLQMDSASWCPSGCGTLFKYLVFPRQDLLGSFSLSSPLSLSLSLSLPPSLLLPSSCTGLLLPAAWLFSLEIFRIIYFARYHHDILPPVRSTVSLALGVNLLSFLLSLSFFLSG